MPAVDPWRPRPVRIVRAWPETEDVFSVALDAPSFAFEPGQFNMLYVFGVGEAAISVCSDPGGPLVHTIRAVGNVTRAMRRLGEGGAIGLRGPYGSRWPLQEAEGGDLLVVAGGVGLPPLRPVVRHALAHRDRFRRVFLLYGARSPEDLVYRRELGEWEGREPGMVRTIVDHAGPSWRGRVGVVPDLLEETPLDPARTTAMLCGPEVMMRFAQRALASRGLPAERVYVSLERSMRCGVGLCGHCQYLPYFLCKDGPVLRFDRVAWLLERREV